MTLNIKNKRSGVLGSTPTAIQLDEGEIGVNYNSSSIALYIKDSIGDIRQIAGPGSEGSFWSLSGSTLSPLSDTYNVQIGAAATGITLNANGEATFASDVTISADLTIGSNAVVLGADGNVALTGKATSDSTVAGDSGTTLTTKDYVDSLDGSTDLGIDNRTATTLDVTSSTGTDATVPAATTTQAGLMTDAQFNKLDGIDPGAQVNVQSNWDETDPTADSFIQNKPVIPSDFGVTKITAGTNITIDPATGVGDVTINATGGGGGGASIEVSDDPPGSPSVGDLWWDSSEGAETNGGRLYLYYTDQWVQTSNIGGGSGGSTTNYWNSNGGVLSPVDGDDVAVGSTTGQGTAAGVKVYDVGTIHAARETSTDTVFSAYTVGDNEPTIRLFANGTITATNQIQTTNIITAREASDPTNNWCYLTNTGLVFNSGEMRIINASGVGVGFNSGQTAWAAISQRSLKTDLKPIESGLEKIATLSAVTGRYKADKKGTSRSFLLADEVKEVLPEAVSGDGTKNDPLNLRYTEVIPLLVSALKEAKDRIDALEAQLTALQEAN